MDGCPPSVSHSFRQKLLVRTETLNKTVRQEDSADPLKPEPVSTKSPDTEACGSDRNTEVKRFGSSSEDGLDGNKTTDIQEFLIHDLEAALERKQENHQLMDHPDSSSWYQSPQRAADPVPQFDHQQILLLQDDHVVQSAAAHLYNKHPSVSSVHVLDQNQRPKQVKGEPVSLSENSSLVLVGHGARDASGQTRISGFTYRDVARIIQSCSRMGHRIRTTTVVACDVGSDEQFVEDLLKKLHEAGVQTELHLWRTVVQVTETGQIISQDVSPDGPQWRHEDSTKKVVVTVGRNGELRRTESLWKGEAVFTNRTDFLQPGARKGSAKRMVATGSRKGSTKKVVATGAQSNVMSNWPDKPKTFLDPNIFKYMEKSEDHDQNEVEQLKERFNELESFSWALFHPEPPEPPVPQTVDVNNPDFNIENFILGSSEKVPVTINWKDQTNVKEELQHCFVIRFGGDMRNIIRHFARNVGNRYTYLMVNNWIFLVDHDSLYVFPVGKQLQNNETAEDIMNMIENHGGEGSENYQKLRGNIPENDKRSYGYYVRTLFLGKPIHHRDLKTELIMTWYFTASCIIESARNFRTFPLTLMVLFMDKNHVPETPDFWFNQHPMARGSSWLNRNRRGFSGCAAPSIVGLNDAVRDQLVEVLEAEDLVLKKWQNFLQQFNNRRDPRDFELEAMRKIVNKYCPLGQVDAEFIKNCKTFLNSVQEGVGGACSLSSPSNF